MNEAQEAWRLWHLLRLAGDALWDRYDREFMDFSSEQREYTGGCASPTERDVVLEDDLPF